jgi:hypothetical protein
LSAGDDGVIVWSGEEILSSGEFYCSRIGHKVSSYVFNFDGSCGGGSAF